MTHPRLSIDAMSSFTWPFERDLALWQKAGVHHAGVLGMKIAEDAEAKTKALTDAGIHISTLITECFELADPASWDKTRDVHRRMIDLVAAQGGHSIYFTPGRTTGSTWRENLDVFAEAVAPTVAYGKEKGVIAAIEPSLRTSVSFVNTLRDAIDVAEQTGIGLIADFGNMWMERDFREVLARAMPHVALMQICDVVIADRTALGPAGRVHIGRGELPLRRMMQDVLDAGYEGVFDLEVVGAELTRVQEESELIDGISRASTLLEDLGI